MSQLSLAGLALGPHSISSFSASEVRQLCLTCQKFTNANGKYPNYQKVGNIARMRVQFVPGSSFLCRPPEEREDEAIEEYVLKINVCLKSMCLKSQLM